MKNILHKSYIQLILGCIILTSITISALSYSSGISGQTQNGCTCHGSSGSATTVSLSSQSGNFIVNPGTSANFSITVNNNSQSAAGVNIAVKTTQTGETNAGSLTAGSGLQLSSGELTHTSSMSLSEGNAVFNFSWTAPTTPGIYYLRATGNAVNSNGGSGGDVWNRSTTQAITVPGVELTSLNGGQSLCPGTQSNITWSVVGVTNVKIELSTNGGSSFNSILVNSTDASAGSWTWNIPSDFAPGTQYKIRISNASDANLNDVSNSNFSIGESAQIATHPQSAQKCTGQSITFSVTASGTNLTYQWRKNNSNISGATQSTYSINSLTLSHAGDYDVVVTAACGNAQTSTQATLSLDESPAISTNPVSQEKCPGESVTFNVSATGTDITYQWLKNGTQINGANANSFSIDNISSNDAGAYSVQVSGVCSPAATSTPANLLVKTPVEISSITSDIIACENDTARITVVANGTNLIYQWRKNGANISGQTSSTLVLANLSKADEGIYDVSINGDCLSSANSSPVNVSVNEKPKISQHPSSIEVTAGDGVVLKVSSNNTAETFQWRKNGININQANDSILSIQSVILSDSGNYDCALANDCGNVTSNNATLSVLPKKAGPAIRLSQNSIDFGMVKVGESKSIIIEGLLENSGDEVLNIEDIEIVGSGSSNFRIIKPTFPLNVSVGEKVNFEFEFNPIISDRVEANLDIKSNSVNTLTISLIGTGNQPNLQFSETTINYGEITFGENQQKELQITNVGNSPVTIIQVYISGENPQDFNLTNSSAPFILAPFQQNDLMIEYNPTNPGESNANINITTDFDSVFVIPLMGSSKIVSVNESNLSIINSISPNPTFSELKINLNIEISDIYEFSIYDNSGKLVKVLQKEYLNKGENSIIWNLLDDSGKNCSSGKYNLIVKNKADINVFHFVINK